MPCLRSNPLLFLLFFIFSTLFSLSHGASHLQHSRSPGVGEGKEFSDVVEWNTRRYLDETSNNSTTLILAANRTHRKDPLDGFKYYRGGWNITNTHYFASLAFSASPLFLIAILWLLVFGLCLCCICLHRCCFCCCCPRKKPYGYSRTAYAVSLILLVLLTIAAIAGSVFLYTGQEKFQNSTVNVISYILNRADITVRKLRDIFNLLVGAKEIGVGEASLPAELQANIEDMKKKINGITDKVRTVTGKSSEDIRNFLKPMRVTLLYVTAAMLILTLLGFLCSILGLQCVVYFLIIIGWLAVVGTFILSGMFLLLHNAVADTCVAMDEWLQNPMANSALEDLIPKANHDQAQAIFTGTNGVTFALVNLTNTAIAVFNVDLPHNAGPLYANRSGPLVPVLCNPFTLNLTDRDCATGEVDFKNATEVWKSFMCEANASGICTTPGRVTPNDYNQLTAMLNISSGLYHDSPFLVDLIDSTYVKETFSAISKDHCPSLRESTKWQYSGFIVVSATMMLSLILWVVYARERRHRKYTKKRLTSLYGSPFDGVKAR